MSLNEIAFEFFKKLKENRQEVINEVKGNSDLVDAINFHCDMHDLSEIAIIN